MCEGTTEPFDIFLHTRGLTARVMPAPPVPATGHVGIRYHDLLEAKAKFFYPETRPHGRTSKAGQNDDWRPRGELDRGNTKGPRPGHWN